jgi:hypothetical protein
VDITEAWEQAVDLELDDPPEYEPDDPDAVYVSPADLDTVRFHGSVIQVTGTHTDTEARVAQLWFWEGFTPGTA